MKRRKSKRKKSAKRGKRFVYRSSITGRFVAKSYVKGHPKTTERETV